MSTTNRAFIKAYRHDTVQPKAEARGARVDAPQAIGSGRKPAITAADPAEARPTRLAETRSATMTERRPLSSYLQTDRAHAPANPQATGQPATAKSSAAEEAFRPGTVVASFQWPAVCRTLLQQNGAQLDQVVRLIQSRARAGNSLVGVLGLFARVGTTTTALCLAARASGRGQSVILADANFQCPRVAAALDAVPTAGWEEFLKHSAPLADAAIRATADNLDVLALGSRPVTDPQALAGGLQAAVTAGILRHAYGVVLLDLGTFFDPATQPTVLELTSNMGIDSVVAVTGPEPADPRDVATIVEHLDRSGCELLGVIENRVPRPKAA